jgi:uncharacterized tellurite resistance protein B-like protein
MLDKIKAFLTIPSALSATDGPDAPKVAVVALLVRAAATADDRFDERERETITQIVAAHFDLSPPQVERLVAAAVAEEAETMDLFRWAQEIKRNYGEEERVELIERMWEVVYADGVLDDYEANLLRRVAGLIYVPDRESGRARLRVMARLGLTLPDA